VSVFQFVKSIFKKKSASSAKYTIYTKYLATLQLPVKVLRAIVFMPGILN